MIRPPCRTYEKSAHTETNEENTFSLYILILSNRNCNRRAGEENIGLEKGFPREASL